MWQTTLIDLATITSSSSYSPADNDGDKPKTPGSGGHRTPNSTSFQAIASTLVPVIVTAAIYLAIFFTIRPRYLHLYAPRTFFRTIPESARTPTTRSDAHLWYREFFRIDDKWILQHHSLDAYLFLRFFRVLILICFVGCCITWPILLPVNATGGGGASQLDRLSFSNAAGQNRLYAHATVAWIFVAFVLLMITRERMFLISIKQAHLTTKSVSNRLSSRTVLFLAAPVAALKKENLTKYFGPNARRSWVAPKLANLEYLVDERNNKVYDLEYAEFQLAQNVNSRNPKENNSSNNSARTSEDGLSGDPDPSVRPTQRKVPLVGKQVDSIDLNLHKLPDIIDDIEKRRQSQLSSTPPREAAIFVEFSDQLSAYQAYQSVRHHSPLALQPRYIGVQPKDVMWKNLALEPSTRVMYDYLSTVVYVATIVLWSIPIGFVGTISNIQYLTDKFKFLGFINNLPPAILGLIQGFLPPFLLSYIVSEVPFFFRWLAKTSGAATTVEAEKRTQHWYFAFQVIQVFLITTFTSGAAAVLQQIAEKPSLIPELLANNLPKASNFYLSYFIIQGIATTASNLLNYSDLLEYLFYDKFLDKTPRQKYDRYVFMRGLSWGAMYPKFANFAVIAIAYSCIAPIMLGFTTIGLYLLYLQNRYNILYTRQAKLDTKGDSYRYAIQHIMVGVYLLELCLIGLLSAREAKGPSTLLIILLVTTIVYHITVDKFLTPLERYMPVDVLSEDADDEGNQNADQEQPLLAAEESSVDPAIRRSFKSSFIFHVAGGRIPTILLDPLGPVLEPRLLPSHETLRPFLSNDRTDNSTPPKYSDEEIKNAYLNPALTSKTPKVWLAKDPGGVSKWGIERNEKIGVGSTDEGAELNKDGKVVWNREDLSKAPIFKLPKVW